MGAGASTLENNLVSDETHESLATLPSDVLEELDLLRAELENLRLEEAKLAGVEGTWMGHRCVRVPSQTRRRRGRSRSPIWSGVFETDTEETLAACLPSNAVAEIEVLRVELETLRQKKTARDEAVDEERFNHRTPSSRDLFPNAIDGAGESMSRR